MPRVNFITFVMTYHLGPCVPSRMFMPKMSKEGFEDIQQRGFRFRQEDPDKASGLFDNEEIQ